MKEMIFKRKSCRSFQSKAVDGDIIERIMSTELKPLYPHIKVRWDIVSRDKVRCICPWTTPQLITVYSEECDGWLENVGFLFQQMDLHIQSLGLGCCWLGMGKMKNGTAPEAEGMKFVIMLAFGYPKSELPTENRAFKRKSMAQISDRDDPRLEPARVAPSSVNSQPWYFVHGDNCIHVYCVEKGLAGYMNRIDIGIALAHLYISDEAGFNFFKADSFPELSGYVYMGSIGDGYER